MTAFSRGSEPGPTSTLYVAPVALDATVTLNARAFADTFGVPGVYTDYHAMLAGEDLDLVSVITRSDQHCQMACDCLAAGVNV